MSRETYLLLNLALAFYNVGTIWAHEVDIFRTWKLVDPAAFRRIQSTHWRKLPYWVFVPVGLGFLGSVGLIWYRPAEAPGWALWFALGCQAAAHVLTGVTWGRWQAALSQDPLGPQSPYLAKILATHWIRTLLINGYGLGLLAMAVGSLPRG